MTTAGARPGREHTGRARCCLRVRNGGATVHGEYKVPGGKLVVVDVEAEGGVLRHVRVAGDFFLEPDEALEAVNRAQSAPSSTGA